MENNVGRFFDEQKDSHVRSGFTSPTGAQLFESKTQRLPKAVLRTDEFCADRAFGEEATFIENPCEGNMSTTSFPQKAREYIRPILHRKIPVSVDREALGFYYRIQLYRIVSVCFFRYVFRKRRMQETGTVWQPSIAKGGYYEKDQ